MACCRGAEPAKKGKPVNLVTNAVGYESASAQGCVFRKKTGLPPKQWLKAEVNNLLRARGLD